MNESEYWDRKLSTQQHQDSLIFQDAQNVVVTELEYKLFSMLKPSLKKDGDQWCCLYGDNIQDGIVGFGSSPYLAIVSFNIAFNTPTKSK